MKQHFAYLGAALVLAACGGASDTDIGGGTTGGGGGGGGEETFDDPTVLPVPGDQTCGNFTCSGEVTSIVFNANGAGAADDVINITGLPFDDDPEGGVYTHLTTTGNGFNIYQNNTPSIFNRYLVIHQDSAGGELTLGVAAIEGYQEHGYTGAWYQLNDLTTTIPGTGLVAYSGTYAGLMTYIGSGDLDRTLGTLAMEVDFTDSVLKGFITGRVIDVNADGLVDGGDTVLPDLVLNDTGIDDGSFSGTANSYDGQDLLESGTYQGFFGGSSAGVIGGIVQVFNPDFAGEATDTEADDLSTRDLGIFIGTD